MVFSKELGYDPDEWEECSDSDQFMLFGFTTRMFLTLTSVILTILFFWLIEARKRLDKSNGAENLSTTEETEALEEWQREVARMEELRLQDLVEHVIDASGSMSDIETESQLIDRFIPADNISINTNSAEMEQFQNRGSVDQTSSSLTSNKFAVEATVHSMPNIEDIDLKLIANLQDAANTIVTTGSERENGSISSTNGIFIEQAQEFVHKPGNADENYLLTPDFGISMENDDDFVKVYKDELQKSGNSGMLLEQIIESSRETFDTLTSMQKTLEERQQAMITGLSSDQLSALVIAADYASQDNQQQRVQLLRKSDNETFEFLPTTTTTTTIATTIEPIENERYDKPIEQIATEETLMLKIIDNNMMNIDEKPETLIPTITNQSLLTDEERRRVVEAEMYIQDAIEYVASETRPEAPTGFVVQEEILNNIGRSNNITNIPVLQQLPASPETTSQMFRTNEIFEKIEEPIEIDDAMTYALEIQSIEIPPDEASLNSENLLDYFDQVAAECIDVLSLPQPKIIIENPPLIKPIESLQSISLLKSSNSFTPSGTPPRIRKRSSLLSVLGVTSTQEMLLTLTSLEDLSNAMRKAGLQSTNLIFGIDYTASNKYQGERCFQGRSLHSIDAFKENPYQQVIKIMGRILALFATSGFIPAYGFGDVKTSDWSVFKLKPEGECKDLDELLQVYDAITPTISLSGPTNFAPLIYEAIEICEKVQNYHILVIVADGQVTNEKATRKAIVRACQYPLSIIVVGVGDGPWDMMKVFDESLPRRPWDNFHFVEFHEVMQKADSIDAGELSFAVQSLLEIPDQYNTVRQLGLLRSVPSIPEQNY
ncbi:Copine family protein 2 [Dirofilaria immitis]|nr:Copine family protein 2 [Dirofilaria immitis]